MKDLVVIYTKCSLPLAHWFRLWVNVQPITLDLKVDPYHVRMCPCEHVLVLAQELYELLC